MVEGKPLPDYSDSDDYQVSLKIRAEIENPRLYIFLHDWDVELNAFELLNLYYINKGIVDNLFTSSLSRLLETEAICEDDYFRYTLGNTYFSIAYHSRCEQYGAQTIRLIYYAIKRTGSAPSSLIISQLQGLYTQKQARTIIAKMFDAGWLSQRGTGRGTTYVWVD